MTEKPIFRASYSVLSAWERGDAQKAINMLFHLEQETNQYLADGIKHHESWRKYIEKTKQLHPQLSSICEPLDDPKCELKLEMPINDHIVLVGVIDCIDNKKICEFKSGTTPSSQYAETRQLPIYALLAEYHGMPRTVGFYYHWNQYFKETDNAMVWITDELKRKTREWVEKVSEEMYEYLVKNGYYEKYKTEVKNDDLVTYDQL